MLQSSDFLEIEREDRRGKTIIPYSLGGIFGGEFDSHGYFKANQKSDFAVEVVKR